MRHRSVFAFILSFVLTVFVPVVSVQALDIPGAFSMPEAPDAGLIAGLTVFRGLFVVPLNNGTVKVYVPGDEGYWFSAPLSAFLENPEGLRGLSLLEWECPARGLRELDLVSVHASGFTTAEARTYEPGAGAHLFSKRTAKPLEKGVLAGPYLSIGCFLGLMTSQRGTDILSWESPDARGSFALRDGSAGLLDGIVPVSEGIRGLELTTDETDVPVLLVATDETVYGVLFTGLGKEVQTRSLNHIPRFTGTMNASCMHGGGSIALKINAADGDGDPILITQTDDRPGFDGTSVTLDCSQLGVYEWTFTASDGKTDDIDLPEATYRITVTDDRPPVWSDFTVYATEGITGTLPAASDPDGDPLTYCLESCLFSDPRSICPPAAFVTVGPDAVFTALRNGTFTYPVAVSDGELETIVSGTFDMAFTCSSLETPEPAGQDPVINVTLATPYFTTIPPSCCTENGCEFFGSRVFKFYVPEGTARVAFKAGTKDFTYDADMLVMHGAVPPNFLHPSDPESSFPDVLSLYDPSLDQWNPAAELCGHRYYWRIRRGGLDGGSTESIGIDYPAAGWYYIKFINTSNYDATLLFVVTN